MRKRRIDVAVDLPGSGVNDRPTCWRACGRACSTSRTGDRGVERQCARHGCSAQPCLLSEADEGSFTHPASLACGFIHPADDLSRVKLLYVPHWVMWKPEWDDNVARFVVNGGTLVLSALTGTRDTDNHIIREQAPGRTLATLAGVRVSEFGRLAPLGADGLFQRGGVAHGLHADPEVPPAESARRRHHLGFGNHELEAAHLYEALDVDPGPSKRYIRRC